MSGGYVCPQEPGDHQVVIFTFSGKITPKQAEEWNEAVKQFKFNTFTPKGSLVAVTIRGEPTPPKYRKGGKKKP